MNTWIAVTIFIILTCHWGAALQCYTCNFTACASPINTTCALMEVCLTESIRPGSRTLKKKSCSASTKCSKGFQITYEGVQVTTTPSCCNKDLCNSAVTPSASILTAIILFISLRAAGRL